MYGIGEVIQLIYLNLLENNMAYPERKPIYDTYKKIVKEIIVSKKCKSYAEGEIDSLDNSILSAFKEIRNILIHDKDWPEET